MHGFYIEHRSLPKGSALSRDLAQHIFMRGAKGGVVVVTSRPHDLLSTTKKQWNALIRQVQREQASTLKLTRITELSNQMAWMQRLIFTAKVEKGFVENSVVFATVDYVAHEPPICSTLYVTTKDISEEELYFITSWLPQKSVVVVYMMESGA